LENLRRKHLIVHKFQGLDMALFDDRTDQQYAIGGMSTGPMGSLNRDPIASGAHMIMALWLLIFFPILLVKVAKF
jgi:hypothetical protein